jgi:membrane protease subunit (stomatin/prohibitin family)
MAAVIAVVKYGGGSDVLAWKFPGEGVGTWTKLVVNESQEAVLFMSGQPFDSFAAGQHELSVENIPSLNGALNLPSGEKSPLPVDVWYINKGYSLEIKWGTPAPVQVLDPKYKALIPLKALGQFNVQFEDSAVFLTKHIGVLPEFDKDSLIKHFRGICLGRLKDDILSYLEAKEISVLEVNTCLDEISEHINEKLAPVIDDLGVKMSGFRVNNIKLSEDSPVVKQINEAMAKKAVTELVGSEFVQETPAPAPAIPVMPPAPTVPEPIPVAPPTQELPAPQPVTVQTVAAAPAVIAPIAAPIAEQAPPAYVDTRRTCPVCYYDMEADERFCRECKHDTAPETPTPPAPVYTEPPPIPQPTVPAYTEPMPSEPIAAVVAEKPVDKRCSGCGTQLRDTQKFCHKCGGRS